MKLKTSVFIVFSLFSFKAIADEAFVSLGERLFMDMRFSNEFVELSKGDVNADLVHGSPSLQHTVFKGQTHSCASCHMVDQDFDDNGMRGYNDFFKKSPIPSKTDEFKTTLRNTPTLIGLASSYYPSRFVHYDAEVTIADTVLGNFTGANMGWAVEEKEAALKNVARVIREDSGNGDLAQEFGGSYSDILLGTSNDIPEELRLAEENRLDVSKATDEQVRETVVKAVVAYLEGIEFEKDEEGSFTGSPYDKFLKLNGIDREPQEGESVKAYNERLREALTNLKEPKFVAPFEIASHKRAIGFGEAELEGAKVFFSVQGRQGQCFQCHTAPMFSDGLFHNVGVSQTEYERVHGVGTFKNLKVPGLEERNNNPKKYFTKQVWNLGGEGVFSKSPSKANVEHADLGVWAIFGRPDMADRTAFIRTLFNNTKDEDILPQLVGQMKTPTVRNLGHSAPYFHDGSSQNIREAVAQYHRISNLTRLGQVVNPDSELEKIFVNGMDQIVLESFLDALNENYE